MTTTARPEPPTELPSAVRGPVLVDGDPAVAAAGTLFAEFDRETQVHGLAPALDLVRPSRYADLQAMADGMSVPGRRFYTKTGYFERLTDELVALAAEHIARPPSPIALIEIYQMGGAIERVPVDATAATASRRVGWYYIVSGAHERPEDDERCAAWARALDDAFEPYRLPGRYINFVADDDEQGQRDAIGPRTFARLAEIKRRHDPDGVFARNPNRRG